MWLCCENSMAMICAQNSTRRAYWCFFCNFIFLLAFLPPFLKKWFSLKLLFQNHAVWNVIVCFCKVKKMNCFWNHLIKFWEVTSALWFDLIYIPLLSSAFAFHGLLLNLALQLCFHHVWYLVFIHLICITTWLLTHSFFPFSLHFQTIFQCASFLFDIIIAAALVLVACK
jgi:hypothetical protein